MRDLPSFAGAKEIGPAESQLLNALTELSTSDTKLQHIISAKDKRIYSLPSNVT
jgi:hypothetical protein